MLLSLQTYRDLSKVKDLHKKWKKH